MASKPGQQSIAKHILTNISGSKGNHAMKFGQLIEHSIRNIFLEKSCAKCEKKLFPNVFARKKIERISGSIV